MFFVFVLTLGSQRMYSSQPGVTGTKALVTRVIDGDTLRAQINGKTQTVRLLGINTPETVDPRKSVQCFGKEASAYAKKLLTKRTVYLESDPTQDDRDKYGRFLRYVLLPDGTNVNRMMIAEGYAYEYTYEIPYAYQNAFQAAQRTAQTQEKGLWAKTTCDGKK